MGSLRSIPHERWGVILAGGDGVRLRPLTRRIAGDDRPKQFCPILGRETLLDQTRRRAALLIPSAQTLVVVTRPHERFFAPLRAEMGSPSLVVQPENRGTAPAILYALLRIAAAAPGGSVALLPSDHYVSNNQAFMAHVEAAFEAVGPRTDLVALLGITPDAPQVEYGWIEPADPIRGRGQAPIYRVRRFWEKPSAPTAERLLEEGCLWNSFVMVAQVSTLLSLIARTLPSLVAAFADLRPALGTSEEEAMALATYARLPETNFSRQVLEKSPESLAVLPVRGVRWSDWGEPGRVLTTLADAGIRPAWAESLLPAPV